MFTKSIFSLAINLDVPAQGKNSPSLLIQKSILPLPLQTAKQAVSASHLCSVIYLLQLPMACPLMQFSIVSVRVNTLAGQRSCKHTCDRLFAYSIKRVLGRDKGCVPGGPTWWPATVHSPGESPPSNTSVSWHKSLPSDPLRQ